MVPFLTLPEKKKSFTLASTVTSYLHCANIQTTRISIYHTKPCTDDRAVCSQQCKTGGIGSGTAAGTGHCT